MIKGAFSHYVPKEVVDELLRNPQLLKLGGEERELSVLFSDIRGFTSIDMQEKLARLRKRWAEEGKPELWSTELGYS